MDQSPERQRSTPWARAFSAGGVVLRVVADQCEFVAIRPAGQDRLQLPKGTIDLGETPREAAVREVREEAGVDGRILHDLGNISYFFRVGGRLLHKRVDFFLMSYLGGNTLDHDHEVDEAMWVQGRDVSRLTFKSERDTVQKALDLVKSGVVALDAAENPSGP